MDTINTVNNSPLTTYHRTTQLDNLETLSIHRTGGTILSFTEHADPRANADFRVQVTSATYERVMSLPVFVPHGVGRVNFAVQGWVSTGTAGKVKVTSGEDATGVESSDFSGTWTGASANESKWELVGTTVQVTENTNELIEVFIKSNGSATAYLTGLVIWFGDASL